MRGSLLSNALEVGFTRDKSLIFLGFKRRIQGRRFEHFGINQQSHDMENRETFAVDSGAQKLSALVPLPRVHLVRYAGYLAPHSKFSGA